MHKARYTDQERADSKNSILELNSTSLKQSSIRLFYHLLRYLNAEFGRRMFLELIFTLHSVY